MKRNIAHRNLAPTRTRRLIPVLGGWLRSPAAVKPYVYSIPCGSNYPAQQCSNQPSWPIGNTKMSSQYMFSYENGSERVMSKVLDTETGHFEEVSRERIERPTLGKGARYAVECYLFMDTMHDGTRTSRMELCRAVDLDFASLDVQTRREFIAAFINRIQIMGFVFFDSHEDVKNLIQSYHP